MISANEARQLTKDLSNKKAELELQMLEESIKLLWESISIYWSFVPSWLTLILANDVIMIEKEMDNVLRAFDERIEELKKFAERLGEPLQKIAGMFPNDSAETTKALKKAIFNCPEYNRINPNAVPCSSFKRLYRVQKR